MLNGTTSSVYQGSSKRLVVALDVGTTFSGVSFCLLDPGLVPKICNVTKYPGQTILGSSKIPSVMFYDLSGNMKCAGAETTLPEYEIQAEDEGWKRVDWFKLHLRPPSMFSIHDSVKIPTLPVGKDIVQIFADFLGYLMECTEKFIKDTYATMTDALWNTLFSRVTIVLSHPNGWEGPQQQQMRRSAILARLVTDTPRGHDRLIFVTEGEASLHFCVRGQFIDDTKQGFVVADLGGGTLDFSIYEVCGQNPLEVRETDMPKCVIEGSVLVTQRACTFLKEKLKKSPYGDEKTLEQIFRKFDETTKMVFRSETDSCFVSFGSPRDNDRDRGIRGGRLKLSGDDVASFFEPSIKATVKAIEDYVKTCSIGISAVYVVGGFSSSPYLKFEVERRLQSHNIRVATPDGQAVKAVADGAVSFFIDHYVTARIAKATYGVQVHVPFDETKEDHMKRMSLVFTSNSGRRRINGSFSTILKKGTVVHETTEFRSQLFREQYLGCSEIFEGNILAYVGPGDPPAWIDSMKLSEKKVLCTIKADMAGKGREEPEQISLTGRKYKTYNYEIILLFGGPEFKAQYCWVEKGVEKRGPAEIVYEKFSSGV
ncbi:hypothetical protein SCHPADRAFT_922429 [Schizopora paradoxa]|uniref:Actin-like ATPase domain-containing protein n=1 Tax=Schizopora paradoxa TaxID=27342 RepID=A0A0H2RBF4_9AGAM|nr:hypothetical protein SCHPADRAFT_922429 [Schizopora paradoxa]